MPTTFPGFPRVVAFTVTGVPLTVTLLAQSWIWMIPDCNPNPYALGICAVGPYHSASALMVARIGGGYIALLSVLISGPILLLAWILSCRRNKDGAENRLRDK